MGRWILNIALALVFVPMAAFGMLLTSHALADGPPEIHTTSELPSGTSTWSMIVEGRTRTFRIYVPESLDRELAAPLVVMLHGGFGSGKQAEKAYGWNAEADAEGFVVLYPDGLRRTWNAGDCCGYADRTDVDDVGFITSALNAVEERISIDDSRVFATGISNGGMMAYRLACETDRFAAIAPVAATMQIACTDPDPISVLHIHGADDGLVRFDGEPGTGMAKVDGPSVPDVMEFWRSVDTCGVPVETVTGDVTTEISTCGKGQTVELIVVAGAGHQWPGSVSKFTGSTVTRTNYASNAIDATPVIWEFFRESAV